MLIQLVRGCATSREVAGRAQSARAASCREVWKSRRPCEILFLSRLCGDAVREHLPQQPEHRAV